MSNILPKKRLFVKFESSELTSFSWHVYNEDNRERVRKDEELAKEKVERARTVSSQSVF